MCAMLAGVQKKENILDSFPNLIPVKICHRVFNNNDGYLL